ncbi:hypothetical protein LCGC14_0141940 [marine sediment metagenome]|uniref:Uncharacterized protein n=1 Tax=marine sediment metagenome TaxID=412755 RepID=A0A0F9V4N7_9ZZZZ
MSKEIIEAVFYCSQTRCKPLMLICSRNQVDKNSGYVFTTQQYMNYIAEIERKYPKSNVTICRDHCGPGFGPKDDTIQSVRDTIRCDLENGFDLIHIDLCHAKMSHQEKINRTVELMKFAKNIRSDVMFEIGTDDNVGIAELDVNKIREDVQACQQVANPVFYVVQTGSLVRETRNTGAFNTDSVGKMHEILKSCGTKLKEHNADYLTREQIVRRRGIVDAVNIAPQLGVVQTNYVLSQALIYGIDTRGFVCRVVHHDNWKKWIDSWEGQYLCALVAGHYHYHEPLYERLISELAEECDVREGILCEITRVIDHYLESLGC